VASARHDFMAGAERKVKFYGYDPVAFVSPEYMDKLSSEYPFEFNLVNITLNYVYNTYREALFSEVEHRSSVFVNE